LDSRLTAKRHLRFFAHSPGLLDQKNKPPTQQEFLQRAKEYGFAINEHNRLCRTVEDVIAFCREFAAKRDEINYEVDGIVVKVNDLSRQAQLGSTLKSPRWAVAFKFPAYQASTIIKQITVQVGRTGVITPVAELQPVPCAGVMISRATLHNFEEIKRLASMPATVCFWNARVTSSLKSSRSSKNIPKQNLRFPKYARLAAGGSKRSGNRMWPGVV